MRRLELPASVLERRAIVYVQQSTLIQVDETLESQRRQYEHVSHARDLGFRDIVVIDDDLMSCSGAGGGPPVIRHPGWGRQGTGAGAGRAPGSWPFASESFSSEYVLWSRDWRTPPVPWSVEEAPPISRRWSAARVPRLHDTEIPAWSRPRCDCWRLVLR